jgi:hypothetical protein
VRPDLIKFSAKAVAFFFVHFASFPSSNKLPSLTPASPITITTTPVTHLHHQIYSTHFISQNGFRSRYVFRRAADVIERFRHATISLRPLSIPTTTRIILEGEEAAGTRRRTFEQLKRRFTPVGSFATKGGVAADFPASRDYSSPRTWLTHFNR